MFGKRKGPDPGLANEVARVSAELERMQSVVRQLQTEQAAMHHDVNRWMRRAVAAERAAGGPNQEPAADAASAPATPDPRQAAMWMRALSQRGARGRIAARRLAAQLQGQAGEPDDEAEETNGVHP